MNNPVPAIITDTLLINLANLSDLEELEILEKACIEYFSFDPPSENNHSASIRQCLTEGDLPPRGTKENYYFFTIRQNKVIIGFLAFYLGHPHNRSAYISVLYIAEQHRQNGLGSEIIKALIEYLKSLNIKEIRLHVSLRNTTGLLFWVKKGFDHITKVECNGNLLPNTFAGIELKYDCS